MHCIFISNYIYLLQLVIIMIVVIDIIILHTVDGRISVYYTVSH